jgi:hypothetical protein
MPEPRYRRNKRTGERAVSVDNGATWEPVEAGSEATTNALIDSNVAAMKASPPEPLHPDERGDPEYEAEHDNGSIASDADIATEEAADAAALAKLPPSNPLSPNYYDQRPIPLGGNAQANAPMQQMAERARPGSFTHGDKPYQVGARNPWEAGDEMVGLGYKLAGIGEDPIVRMAGRGMRASVDPRSEYAAARDDERGIQDRAREESPFEYGLGQGATEMIATAPLMATGVGAAIPAVNAAARAAPLAVRAAAPTVAQVAAAGGVQGAAGGMMRAGGESTGTTPGEIAEDVAQGGLYGGGAGFATGGVMAAAPRGAAAAIPLGLAGGTYGALTSDDTSISGRAQNAAIYGLGAATAGSALVGAGMPQVTREALESGVLPRGASAVQGIANKAARMRAGASGAYGAEVDKVAKQMKLPPEAAMVKLGNEIERLGIHKRPGGAALPSTPNVYADNAARVQSKAGREISTTLAEAGEQGVSYPKEDVVARLARLASRAGKDTDADSSRARTLARLASKVEDKPGESLSPQQLWALKKKYEKAGGYRGDRNAPMGTAVKAEAHRDAAGIPRRALHEVMREQSYQGAPINALGGDRDFGTAQRFAQAMEDYGPASTVKNLADKRVAHGMGNNPVPLTAGAQGGIAGAAIHGVNTVGRDVGANALRSLEAVARTGAIAPPAFGGVATGAAAASGAAPDRPAVQPPPALPPPQPAPLPRSPAPAVSEPGRSHGNQLPERIQEALLSNEGGEPLGQFTQPLRDAFDTGDDKQINAAIARVTDDPAFRRDYLPMLEQRASR